MYAVIAEKVICHLGSNLEQATEILESKKQASLVTVRTLPELACALQGAQTTQHNTLNEEFSQAIERVFGALDKAGINELRNSEKSVEEVVAVLKQRSQTAVAEVRHLGIKGMKTVGDGFIALGDLLKKASEQDSGD